ncbi:MAG: hypothetical protein MRZ29_04525 [Oscillospiraceae bacterium]|nr:hypothetical protein [Oscillospiraceae bacterium]
MSRQFYDGYPKIYDRRKDVLCTENEPFEENDCIENSGEKCGACKCEKKHKENCVQEKKCCVQEKKCIENEDVCCEKKQECCDVKSSPDMCCNLKNQSILSACGLNGLEGIFNNFALDDIILLGIAIILLHDGTSDTLLLVIIGIIFLVGLT